MSEPRPMLAYESPPPGRLSGWRTAAWISQLVLGILYALAGLCLGGSTILVSSVMETLLAAGGPGTPALPPNFRWIMIGAGLALLAIMWAVAVTHIWTALLVRRGSRAAAVTGLVIAILNAVVILGVIALAVVAMLAGPGRHDPTGLIGVLVYLLPTAANIWVAIALGMVLREKRAAVF